MNQHLAYFNTGKRGNAIEGWGYIDERISTSLGPQAFGLRRCNPYGLDGGYGIFLKYKMIECKNQEKENCKTKLRSVEKKGGPSALRMVES